MFFRFSSWFKLALPLAVAFALLAVWVQNKRYVFDETELIRVTQKHIGSQTFGQDHRTAFAAIAKELKRRHPASGVLNIPDGKFQWMWTRIGGLVGASTIMYSSFTEFIAFFGTSVETSGFTPRCFANITATVVQGSVKVWTEGQTGGKRYIPAETLRLSTGESSALQIDSSSWMVLHGRGLLFSCLPPLLLQHLLAFDFHSILRLVKQITMALFSSSVFPL